MRQVLAGESVGSLQVHDRIPGCRSFARERPVLLACHHKFRGQAESARAEVEAYPPAQGRDPRQVRVGVGVLCIDIVHPQVQAENIVESDPEIRFSASKARVALRVLDL